MKSYDLNWASGFHNGLKQDWANYKEDVLAEPNIFRKAITAFNLFCFHVFMFGFTVFAYYLLGAVIYYVGEMVVEGLLYVYALPISAEQWVGAGLVIAVVCLLLYISELIFGLWPGRVLTTGFVVLLLWGLATKESLNVPINNHEALINNTPINNYEEIFTSPLTPESARQTSKEVRVRYTDMLKEHGVTGKGHGFCTDEIYRGLFGGTVAEVREIRGLPKGTNLRDVMSLEELQNIVTVEETLTGIIKKENLMGDNACKFNYIVATTVAEDDEDDSEGEDDIEENPYPYGPGLFMQ